jgi:hypothetical protein
MAYSSPSITASGLTWAQLQAGGASGHLEALITAQAATAAPTSAPTLATSGSSGTLTATTYYVVVTETNGIGETTASPVSSGLPISGTQGIQVTFPSLKSGNTARNTYVGTASGGPFTLQATGTTASTVVINSLKTNSYAVNPPTSNSTGLTFTNANGVVDCKTLELIRAGKDGNLEDLYRYYAKVIRSFIKGDATKFPGTIEKLRHAHTAFLMLATMCAEAGALIDANPGTIGTTFLPIGIPQTTRTWP